MLSACLTLFSAGMDQGCEWFLTKNGVPINTVHREGMLESSTRRLVPKSVTHPFTT
jgi:hypothetical protein